MFKKILIATTLVASTSVFAQSSVTITSGNQAATTGVDSSIINVSAKTRLFGQTDADVGILTTRAETTDKLTNRYELGLTQNMPIDGTGLSFSLRGAVGQKAVSTSQPFNYHSVEPAVTAKVGAVTAKLGYRWRDAFNNVNADKSETTRFAITYDLTKKDKIGVGYDILRGDGANKSTTVAYTRNF